MSDGGQEVDAGKRIDRYPRAAAAGGGALVGAGVGGPIGAIVGASLGVLLEPFAEKVWGELRRDSQQRQGDALAAAQEAMGVDSAELGQRILASDASRLQAGVALLSASQTAWPPKVRALGRALASGLMAADDTRIDTEPLIMAALADIEFPQASLLELLVCHWPSSTPEGGVVAEPYNAPDGAPWQPGQRIWLPGDIALVRPRLRPVLPSLLGPLQRHGLAAQSDEPGDPFGRSGRAMQQRFLAILHRDKAAGQILERSRAMRPRAAGCLRSLARKSLTLSLMLGPNLPTDVLIQYQPLAFGLSAWE
jgi:hypothetical protein